MLVLEAIGNLGADAIIKDLNGQKYIAFSVAHTESYKDSQGQRHERTTWVSCLKYGESQVINYLKKGTRVFIRGELSAKAYEAGGALQAGINCRVRELQLLGGNRADQNRSPPAGRNDFGRYTNLRAAGISATRRSRRFAILTIIDMIGKKLSPVLEEMEATLWEYEAFNGAKPNYTLEGFRASTKIFMSALLDKFFEKQQAEGVSQEDTLKAVEKLGQDVRALVFNATGIDTHLLYNRTKVN